MLDGSEAVLSRKIIIPRYSVKFSCTLPTAWESWGLLADGNRLFLNLFEQWALLPLIFFSTLSYLPNIHTLLSTQLNTWGGSSSDRWSFVYLGFSSLYCALETLSGHSPMLTSFISSSSATTILRCLMSGCFQPVSYILFVSGMSANPVLITSFWSETVLKFSSL